MNKIRLNILRKRSFVGAVMRYRIFVNGQEIAKLTNGQSVTYETDAADKIALRVALEGNALTFHGLNKEVVLFPQYCKTGEINCVIETRLNILGAVSYGLLAPVGNVNIKTEYL